MVSCLSALQEDEGQQRQLRSTWQSIPWAQEESHYLPMCWSLIPYPIVLMIGAYPIQAQDYYAIITSSLCVY